MKRYCRLLTFLLTACYLQAVTTSALFHQHDFNHSKSSCHCNGHENCASEFSEGISVVADSDNECSVCQFLAQKPVPNVPVALPELATPLSLAILPDSPQLPAIVFSAWQSRGPPGLF